MNIRDWSLVGSGAAAASVMALLLGRVVDPPGERTSRLVREQRPAPVLADPREGEGRPSTSRGPNVEASATGPRDNAQLARVREKLAEVQREKKELQAQLRALEKESAAQSEEARRYEFDVTPDEWKELAGRGLVKFSVPCFIPPDLPWNMSESELDELGLSPEEGEVLAEAHRRSNARVWAALRPSCARAVNSPEVADLLGPSGCMTLIEEASEKADLLGPTNARRQVSEVHAGLRPPPKPGEPQHPVYEMYMALTTEAQQFEADLASSFGPEDAKRIRQSMKCVTTMK